MKTFVKLIADDLVETKVTLMLGGYYLDTSNRLWLCTTGDSSEFIVVNTKTGDRRNPDTLSLTKQITNLKISYS